MIGAAQKGNGVFSVFITDGRASPRQDPSISDEEMAIQREAEAKTSIEKIGATGAFFLQNKSEAIKGLGAKDLKIKLSQIFDFIRPAEVYLPGPYERHRTHQQCTPG